jgi:hypothetical protein
VDSPELSRRLRLEVGRFREAQHRRRFDVEVHVGMLAGSRLSAPVPARDLGCYDRALRVDVLLGLLADAPGDTDTGWLTRPGVTRLHDEDITWCAAAAGAFGIVGRELTGFYAITREGWLDVRTGERRVWKRLRLRR